MAHRENISVSFTPHQVEFLAGCVESGDYQTTSEAVREGVRLLEQRRRRQAQIEQARALILEGAMQLERGETIDGKEFFREWDEELDALDPGQPPSPE